MTSISHACGRCVAVLFGLLVCTCPAPGRSQDQANTTERKATVGTILPLQGPLAARFKQSVPLPTPPPQYQGYPQSESTSSRSVRCLTQQCKPLVYFGYKALAESRNPALDREVAPLFAEHAHALAAIVIAVGAAAIGLARRVGRSFRRQ